MRKLELSDVFKLSEMIDVMGIELDLNQLLNKAKEKKGNIQANAGAEVGFMFVKKMYKAEKLVYKFIADLTGDKVDEVKRYNVKQLLAFFNELVNDEDFSDFFTQV